MKNSIYALILITLIACNNQSNPDLSELSSDELMQLAVDKAQEEALNEAEMGEQKPVEPIETSEALIEIDSIEIALENWRGDYSMFNNVGFQRPDSVLPLNFSGRYKYQNGDFNFTLSMGQREDQLGGSYCGYTNTRVDCGMESQGVADPLVKGKVMGDTAHIYYYSNYGHNFGRAKVYFVNDTLIWKSTETPEALFIGVPSKAKLIFIGEQMEDYEVFPDPDMEGC